MASRDLSTQNAFEPRPRSRGRERRKEMEHLLAELGRRLGLFTALNVGGPATASDLARSTGLDEGCVQDWLAAMKDAGLLEYDPDTRRFQPPKSE